VVVVHSEGGHDNGIEFMRDYEGKEGCGHISGGTRTARRTHVGHSIGAVGYSAFLCMLPAYRSMVGRGWDSEISRRALGGTHRRTLGASRRFPCHRCVASSSAAQRSL
jgi:hypothetical protein